MKASDKLVDETGGVDMDENAGRVVEAYLEAIMTEDTEEDTEIFEMFKSLYLEWLRFFRANMRCGWECPGTCELPDDCPEIDRVWRVWLDTLSEGQRALLN